MKKPKTLRARVRRTVAAVLAALLLPAFFAGCSSNETEESRTKNKKTTKETAAFETAAAPTQETERANETDGGTSKETKVIRITEEPETAPVKEKAPSEGLEFQLYDNDAYMVSGIGTCNDTDLIIPAYHNGKPVTIIGGKSTGFTDGFIGIELPEYVKSITIPETVELFYFSRNELEQITVDPENKIYYSEGNCIIRKDDHGLVYGCKTSVIPDSANYINDGAFWGCEGLKSIVIPESITHISDNAFCGTGLTSVTIPDSVKGIGMDAFSCGNLEQIHIGSGIAHIGSYDFSSCGSISEITVASDNQYIYSEGNCVIERESKTLLTGCNTSVIPDGVTEIQTGAFINRTGLTRINIPDSVTYIRYQAFAGCSNLERIDYSGTKAQWEAINKDVSGPPAWDDGTGNYTVYCTDGVITK